jgi:hypothetical protein
MTRDDLDRLDDAQQALIDVGFARNLTGEQAAKLRRAHVVLAHPRPSGSSGSPYRRPPSRTSSSTS